MLQEFLYYLEKEQLLDPGSRVLLAVSGGVDSVVMSHLFQQAGLDFGVGHCNFQLRGQASDEDERFVLALADKWGVDDVTLHAGEYKDIGSPWRQMTDKEKDMMQELLDDVHEEFMQAVIAGRSNAPNPMTEEQVRAAATGMIYTGTKAKELGLVDEIGGLEEAKAEVRRMANVGQDFPVEPEAAPSLLEELLGVSMQGQAPNPLAKFVADPLSLMAGRLYMNTTLRDIVLR